MKNLTKLSLIAVALTVLAGSTGFAADQQLENRLALERARAGANPRATTVAVYAGRHGVSQRNVVQAERMEGRYEMRSNGHGGTFSVWVPAK